METREDDLDLREMLEALLDDKAKRRLELQRLPNRTLFQRYERQQLAIRNQDAKTFGWNKLLLRHFQSFLRGQKPTPDLAREFLSQYQGKASTYSLYKYSCVLRGFFDWYGHEYNVKLPTDRPLPPYIAHSTVMAFREAMFTKPRHRETIPRDVMIVDVAYGSGLRRKELANLYIRDLALDEGFLVVRKGKHRKDRVVYLPPWLTEKLRCFLDDARLDRKVFGISAARISAMMVTYSEHSGLKLKPHDLRHGYATRLAENGVPIRVIQELLGHASVDTTQVYTSFTDRAMREAVQTLEQASRPATF